MIKDFDAWNAKKKQLESRDPKRYFIREREVWFCSLGLNIGFEEDGKNNNFERPVVIYKKFSQNLYWAIPLTTKIKPNNRYYVTLRYGKTNYAAMTSQMRILDVRRLQRYMYRMDKKEFKKVQVAIRELI